MCVGEMGRWGCLINKTSENQIQDCQIKLHARTNFKIYNTSQKELIHPIFIYLVEKSEVSLSNLIKFSQTGAFEVEVTTCY